MELKDIKALNQHIYELDEKISRESKVVFIATFIFAIKLVDDFANVNKLTSLIDFVAENKRPIDQLLDLARKGIKNLHLQEKTEQAVLDSLETISGTNTKLNTNKEELKKFFIEFIAEAYPTIQTSDLFFETLYMEIDKKAGKSDDGIVLTPDFIAGLMIDLAEIDYKKDVVADLCSGTGLFSLLSYSKMFNDMNSDFKNKKITQEQYKEYSLCLLNSIIANDNDPKMVTLCLANFLLKDLNHTLLFAVDCLTLQKSSFKINQNGTEHLITPTKAILNPPYEDKLKPLEILEKNIQLIKESGSTGHKVVIIIPPQKFGQKKDIFSKILNVATLQSVIKTQDELFKDSGKAQPASIFVFSVDRPHKKEDVIHYYNFTDTGYVYLKDSGLVDKNHTFEQKKSVLLEKIKNANNELKESNTTRTWSNFYDVMLDLEIDAQIDPTKIKTSNEEADITLENITIKKMLKEKQKLIDEAQNNFVDSDGSFENYIVDILSED